MGALLDPRAQEIIAILVSAAALLYLTRRLTGWPRKKKTLASGRDVIVGARLARGLKSRPRRSS